MLRRFAEPISGNLIVLFYAFTVFVFLSKFDLGVGVAPVGGFLIPLYCFLNVDRPEPILFVSDSQPELRFRIALLRSSIRKRSSGWESLTNRIALPYRLAPQLAASTSLLRR